MHEHRRWPAIMSLFNLRNHLSFVNRGVQESCLADIFLIAHLKLLSVIVLARSQNGDAIICAAYPDLQQQFLRLTLTFLALHTQSLQQRFCDDGLHAGFRISSIQLVPDQDPALGFQTALMPALGCPR